MPYSPIDARQIHDKQVRAGHGNAYRRNHPEIREAFTRAPDMRVFANRAEPVTPDKQVRAGHGNAIRITQPRDQRGVHGSTRRGVFANRAVARNFETNRFDPDRARCVGLTQPRDQRGVHGSTRRGVLANRAGLASSRQTGSSRTRQCLPVHSTPRPAWRSPFLPTWCTRQSCR